ncbi:uncharacterized protein LOC118430883 [Branchiostoma floridae]|uniref:Leucine-rich repeat protein SHOC-2 n=1 Tax=Branchiostoma floridae TaxID=7739 RepID=A0A9J7MEN6_BRAFL|nr:uncharacterized protein LOC118430883 [Branchiostoma floridae]
MEALDLSLNENIDLSNVRSRHLTVLRLDDCNLNTLPLILLKLPNLQKLDLSGNKQICLPDVLYKLKNIKVLRLSDCELGTVPSAVLKLTQLEELDLSYNSGVHLPDELSRLTNLRVLKLDNTDMVTVSPVVWRLVQLERLDLSGNSQQTLPAEVVQLGKAKYLDLPHYQLNTLPLEVGTLTKLEWLDLRQCQLHTLPPEVWRLTQLQWLDLSSNSLQTLPAEVGQLSNVKYFGLSHCQVRTLPPEVGRLTQLEWLRLGINPLQTLPAEIGQLNNVKHLDLSHCQLRTLPPEVGRLTQLEHLDLHYNPLRTLPAEVGQLTNVKHLDLSLCQLHTLPPEVGNLSQLEWVNLSSNSIQTLPTEVDQLSNIKHLNLSHCQLRTLPPEVGRLAQLEWLDLKDNPLQTLPTEVGKLTLKIKHLDLSNCQLHTLPVEVIRLTQLEYLDLRNNPQNMLPAIVGRLTDIKRLDLSDRRLTTLPPEVFRLTQLEWLVLRNNALQTLTAEVGKLTKIKHLDLSNCRLRTLPPEVGKLIQLEWLNLSWNPLQTLPAEVGQFTNVKHLHLSHCKLNTIPPELWTLTQQEWLDLSDNQLQTLSAEVGQLTNLSHLYVSKNPLIKPPPEVCSQGITAIRQYYDELERSEEKVSARLKVVVLGDTMAGKTSLVQTLQRGESTLTKEEDRTHCVEITQWAPDDNITFEVYDFGGHDVYHLTHQFFLTQGALNLLTVDLQTYNCTEQRYTEAVGFWLDTLNTRVPGAVVTIVGSKMDECSSAEIEEKTRDIRKRYEKQQLSWKRSMEWHIQKLGNDIDRSDAPKVGGQKELKKQLEHTQSLLERPLRLVGMYCVSSVEPTSRLDSLRSHLLESANNTSLFPILRRILPGTWVDFEQQIHKLRDKGTEREKLYSWKTTGSDDDDTSSDDDDMSSLHLQSDRERDKKPKWMTWAFCSDLAGLTADRLEPVLSYLQQVGTILRYTDIPELKELVFHDPPALIELFKDLFHHDTKELFSIPRLQNANYTSVQLRGFEQDLCDCGLIRKDVLTCMLPLDVAPDIVIALMQNFGLCFELKAEDKTDPSKHTCHYKIPWYLYKEMPEELMSVWPEDVRKEQIQLQLMCDIRGFCPRGLFQRFSVGIHPFVKDRIDWRDGVLAYRQGYPVQVCSKPAADDTYITMATRGRLAQAGEMWGVVHPLLEVLVQLLQEWPGVLYSLHVTCAHCIKARLDNPHQYDLRDRTADDGRDVRCPHPEVKYTASTSADLVYRPYGIQANGSNQHLRALQGSISLIAEVSGSSGDEFDRLKWLPTEAKVKDAYEAHYTRLAARVCELGLTFRDEVPGDGNCMFHAVSDQVLRTEGRNITHLQLREQAVTHLRRNPRNAHGDHLSNFILNQTWEEYLETMSRDGTWGDHVVLQAMAGMLGRDVIIVSSVEADNYVTVLQPQSGANPETARPLLLGHYAENHYASLDETLSGGKPVVLLVIDEVGTSKGGISTINGQLLDLLTVRAKVLCTVLHATEEEKREARRHGIDLVLPMANTTGESRPTLDWITFHHKQRYPILRSDISVIVGHADVTSTAARNIKTERLPSAKVILYNHVMPEDTEHHKSGDKAMGIGDKTEAIDKDIEEADVVFSVGPTMFDYYKNEIRGLKKTHHQFLPKPSEIFSNLDVEYEETETKVVLSVGRVKGVEKLKGYDLVAKTMIIVIERFPKARWRVRGISAKDFAESKEIIQANMDNETFTFTPLAYGTQEQLRKDFRKAHVVLMPSRAEPFGLVGLEAIAAGVPVLVSSNSGLAEFLEKHDPEFSRRIVDLKGADDEVAERLADRIIKVLDGGREEFEAAKRLKDNLLASKYWEESHRKFLEECGIPQ